MKNTNLVASLRQQIRQLEGSRRTTRLACVSSGCSELDYHLPAGGFAGGTLVEWLIGRRGSGAGTLALLAARQAMAQDGGALVVLDRAARLYPPALAAWGIDLGRTIRSAVCQQNSRLPQSTNKREIRSSRSRNFCNSAM